MPHIEIKDILGFIVTLLVGVLGFIGTWNGIRATKRAAAAELEFKKRAAATDLALKEAELTLKESEKRAAEAESRQAAEAARAITLDRRSEELFEENRELRTGLKDEIQRLRAEVGDYRQTSTDAKAQADQAMTDHANCQEENRKLKTQVDTMAIQIAKLESTVQEMKAERAQAPQQPPAPGTVTADIHISGPVTQTDLAAKTA